MRRNREAAETRALMTLAWLAGNSDLLPVFLSSTGAAADTLKERAGDPDFLGAVLDFILMDDAWVMALCDEQGWAYDDLMEARAALPGGEQTHWT